MNVKVLNLGTGEKLKYVVVCVRCKEKWLFTRQKWKVTWELPGGHIEKNETILEAAKRELYEETGIIIVKDLIPICDYYVEITSTNNAYGRLFVCHVDMLSTPPELYEMAQIRLFKRLPLLLTHRFIHKPLYFKAIEYLNLSN